MGILLLHVFIAKFVLAPFFTFNTVDCITGISRRDREDAVLGGGAIGGKWGMLFDQ